MPRPVVMNLATLQPEVWLSMVANGGHARGDPRATRVGEEVIWHKDLLGMGLSLVTPMIAARQRHHAGFMPSACPRPGQHASFA